VDVDAIAGRYGLPLLPANATGGEGVADVADVADVAGVAEGETGDVGEGLPSNLVLSDEQWAAVVSLATDVDLSRYSITPDNSASGYRVIDRRTGQRLIGFAARQVVKAFQNARKKAAVQAERAARQAQREQEQAAKKAQREQEQAAKKAQREQERAAKKAERERTRLEQAVVQAARAERRELEARTRTLDPDLAGEVIARAGWAVETDVVPDMDRAVREAEALAADNPDAVVSVVRVKGGFVVITKPKTAIKTRGSGPANVALTADAGEVNGDDHDHDHDHDHDQSEDREGHDGTVPGAATLELFTEAARRIAAFFGERPDLDDVDPGAAGAGVDAYPDERPDDDEREDGEDGDRGDTGDTGDAGKGGADDTAGVD
jgi:hypothetical protein